MIALTAEMAYELLLWGLLAFTLISCAFGILCVVLYRRLVATKRMLGDSPLVLRPDTVGSEEASKKEQ